MILVLRLIYPYQRRVRIRGRRKVIGIQYITHNWCFIMTHAGLKIIGKTKGNFLPKSKKKSNQIMALSYHKCPTKRKNIKIYFFISCNFHDAVRNFRVKVQAGDIKLSISRKGSKIFQCCKIFL